MTASQTAPPATALTWRTIDDYHARTDCGRYSVARVTVKGETQYVAWQREAPITEIAVRALQAGATDADRAEAREAMKRACAEHAGRARA